MDRAVSAPATAAARVDLGAIPRRFSWVLSEAVLFPVVGLYLLTLAGALPRELLSDSWLVIVAGREVVQNGFPSHDTLTIWTQGREWVDQQWLGQVLFYGLYSLGGIKLAALGHVAAAGSAFVLAIVFARRRGGSTRSICWISLPAIFLLIWGSWNVRAQSLAFVLFITVVWLLIQDARSPSPKVFLAFPLLVLWANIHGTALTGALLVSLAGITYGFERRQGPLPEWGPRAFMLSLAPIACVFASPYAFGLPDYYHRILGNSGFRDFIIEWAPTAPSFQTAPFYLLAFLTVWLVGRCGDRLLRFEKVLLAVTLLMALQTLRSVIWFTFVVLILVPVALDGVLKPNTAAMRFGALNRALVALSTTGVVLVLTVVATKPSSWFEESYPRQILAAVERTAAADPSMRVWANEAYADWLLLRRPELQGRIAFDARFELASRTQIERLVDVRRTVEGWRRVVAPYGLFVLQKTDERLFARALLREPGARVEYRGHDAIVISRPLKRSSRR